ncbi:hypothetical protein Aperf_G00000056896 [Anoplocephala perfoliata]
MMPLMLRFLGVSRNFYFRFPLYSSLNAAKFSTNKEPIDLELEVKGHEPAVLKSYESFIKNVCSHFDLDCSAETRNSPIFDRLSLNKSPFIHKKHQRQYEFRTYVKIFTIPHLTGCTANIFLEYVQRNIPGGVHMIVKQHRVEPLPGALRTSSRVPQ